MDIEPTGTRSHWRRHANPQPLDVLTVPGALMAMPALRAVTGLSTPTIYRKMAAGDFPAGVKLSARCTRWRSDEVAAWLAAQ
jgi:prophage regulatory protein